MRRKFLATAIMVGLMGTAACGGESDAGSGDGGGEGDGEIAIITVDPSNPYWSAEVATAEALAEEMGYTTTTGAHGNDPDEQTRLMETAINNNVAGILLDPAGADESVAIVEQAVDAGIPVSLVNAEISETGLAEAQIVSNNAQGAALGAEAWAEAMDYEGTYVELYGNPSDNNAPVRSEGYESVLSQYPDLEKVGEEIANWDRQEGQTAMEQLLSRYPDIDGVISGNDEMALGAINALEEAGRWTRSRSWASTAATTPRRRWPRAAWSPRCCSRSPTAPPRRWRSSMRSSAPGRTRWRTRRSRWTASSSPRRTRAS